MKYGELLD